jgi:hypothetical protein
VSTKNDRPAEPGPSASLAADSAAATSDNPAATPDARPFPGTGRAMTWGLILAAAAAALTYGLVGAKLSPGAPLFILTVGGGAMAFCGISLYRVLEPLLRPAAAAARAAGTRQSTRLRELEREKGLVLKAIREIEHDFQMRKISESDYKEMTHRYRTRALRLIREIDAGDDFRGLIEQELKTRLAAQAAAPAAEPKA